MSENNRNIDELFRQELGNATEAPPSSVWEVLEQRLDQASPPQKGTWGPYRLFVLFLIVAALITSYFIWHSRATKDSKPVHNETGAKFSTGITDPLPASAGQAGSDKDTTQMLLAKASQPEQPGNKAAHYPKHPGETSAQNMANKTASGRKNRLQGKPDEEQTGRELQRSAARQKSAKQITARNTSRQATTENSTAQQQPIAPLKHSVQDVADTGRSGGTKPGQNSTAATLKKTGRQTPGRTTNSAGVAGVSKELLSSSAHGARTQNTGKGQSPVSTAATEQNRSLEKAGNKEKTAAAATTATMVPAKATLAAKDSKESLAASHTGKTAATPQKTVQPEKTTTTAEQAKTASNSSKDALAASHTGKTTATPQKTMQPEKTTVTGEQAKTANNSSKDALAASHTGKTAATTQKTVQPEKIPATAEQAKTASNSSKDALAASHTGKTDATPQKTVQPEKTTATAEAKTASNSSKDALAASHTGKTAAAPQKTVQPEKTTATAEAKTASNSSKDALAASHTGKTAAAPQKTVQPEKIPATAEQAKTASNSSKDALAASHTGKTAATPQKTVQPEKTTATAEQAKTASSSSKDALAVSHTGKTAATPQKTVQPEKTTATAEQAKTASNSSKDALTVNHTGKTAATPEQNKTSAAAKRGKDTIPQNKVSAAGTAQNKAPEKAVKSKAGVQPVPRATAQVTARQTKADREPARSKQQEQKEKNPLSGKNEIPQNEDSEDQASVSEGSTGGQSGGNTLPLAKEKTRRPLNMSAGIKAAYEKGFQSYTANTIVASVFGEVNFSPKVSLIIQPGIKMANTSSEYRTANGTYIRAGDTKSTVYNEERDSMNIPTGFRSYAYSQTYDSIVASRRAQRKFTEFELPFMVRYKMDKNLSLLAGMNFTFGKTLKMEGLLQTYSGLQLADSIFRYYDSAGIAPPAPAAFSHPGSVSFSTYKDPGATEVINMIRFGYTIGLSYTVKQRLIVDLTLQQNLSRLSDIDDEQIKKLFTQPYVRLSAGYSILGKRK